MKKTLITTLITSAFVASAFAQGVIQFKTGNADLIKFSTDGATASSVTGTGNSVGTAGSLGPVTIQIWSAPVGTSLAGDNTAASLIAALTGAGSPWALATFASTPGLLGAGTYNAVSATLGNGSAGANQEIEIIGFTGSSLANRTAFGFSGMSFNGGAQLGSLGWSQSTGNPNGVPPTAASPIATGASGFQGFVVTTVPEPTTIALAGLGAASLLFFRRRK